MLSETVWDESVLQRRKQSLKFRFVISLPQYRYVLTICLRLGSNEFRVNNRCIR
jgi:hypothetical protein